MLRFEVVLVEVVLLVIAVFPILLFGARRLRDGRGPTFRQVLTQRQAKAMAG